MTKKKRLCLGLVAILIMGIGFVLLVPEWRAIPLGYIRGEPFHKGKPLGYWVVRAQHRNVLHQLPLLHLIFPDDRSRERDEAFNALVVLEPESVPVLTHFLQTDNRRHVREQAVVSLGEIGPEAKAAVPVLLRELKSNAQDGNLRAMIVYALGRIDQEAACSSSIEALKDEDETVRSMAVRNLMDFRGPNAETTVSALTEALEVEADKNIQRLLTHVIEQLQKQNPEAAGHAGAK